MSESRTAPEIGIVTVLYGSESVLPDFFASLARQSDVRFRLYVIDNSPTSAGLDLARQLAQVHDVDTVFVFNGANLGFARGSNQGIGLAMGDGCPHILLANNDTEFGPGTLSRLRAALQGGDMVATPKILYHGPERLIWYAGGAIQPWTMRTPHVGMRQQDTGQFDRAGRTGFAPGCFLLFDTAVFRRIGLLDETYFVYYEDADYAWRLRDSGIMIRYAPESVVVHKVSALTGGSASPFTQYYSNRNRIYFIRKNLHGMQRLVALSYVLAGRLFFLLRLPRPLAASLWKGLWDGLKLPLPTPSSTGSPSDGR